MEHSKLMELEKKHGCKFSMCDCCGDWYPTHKMRPFMGKNVCNPCWWSFRKVIKGLTNPSQLANWLIKNVEFDIEIKIDGVEYRKKP